MTTISCSASDVTHHRCLRGGPALLLSRNSCSVEVLTVAKVSLRRRPFDILSPNSQRATKPFLCKTSPNHCFVRFRSAKEKLQRSSRSGKKKKKNDSWLKLKRYEQAHKQDGFRCRSGGAPGDAGPARVETVPVGKEQPDAAAAHKKTGDRSICVVAPLILDHDERPAGKKGNARGTLRAHKYFWR